MLIMKTFLTRVAEAYLTHEPLENLMDYAFVLPNKRSRDFMKRALEEGVRRRGLKAVLMPEVTNIDRLLEAMVPDLTPATQYQQLFTLYNVYRRLEGEHAREFDRFRFWGEIILNDFNDIDRYLVDAQELLKNISDYKDIRSQYLTEEHLDLLRRYWGDVEPQYSEERFWVHTGPDGEELPSPPENHLWGLLPKLYSAFHEELLKQGLATPGYMQRVAVERMGRRGSDRLTAARYIFVGFGLLTGVEQQLMSRLKAGDRADFYWTWSKGDWDEQNVFRQYYNQTSEFKSRYTLEPANEPHETEISIVGIPSRVGQTAYDTLALERWAEEKSMASPADAIDTAIVLPDQGLLEATINAVPEVYTTLNVTMGLPLRLTPMASLLRHIISMHLRARTADGQMRYFRDDVLALVGHPLLHSVEPEEVNALNEEVKRRRLFFLSQEEITACAPTLEPVFKSIADIHSFTEVHDYLKGVLDFLKADLSKAGQYGTGAMKVLDEYSKALKDLHRAVAKYHITMEESTMLQMIESAFASRELHLSGEPLKGLQVMGLMETRALDFDNVIVTAMNERTLPRRSFGGTFIAEKFRYHYLMPTASRRDAEQALMFFRLVRSARRVVLTYDSRPASTRTTERSRLLNQLLYSNIPGVNVSHTAVSLGMAAPEEMLPSVEKTPAVMAKLEGFLKEGSGQNFSPSSINRYIECPLKFYLGTVERLEPPADDAEFIDSSNYGTIVHEIAERLYKSLRRNPENRDEEALVTRETFDDWLNRRHTVIDPLITQVINRIYNKLEEPDLNRPLAGNAYAIGHIISKFIGRMLEVEREQAPFVFVDGERRNNPKRLRLSSDMTVNYSHIIDRIDRHDGCLRIIDYKTGSDKTSFTSVEQLFTPSSNRPKAILQMMLYCNVYAREEGCEGEPIAPWIYKLQEINQKGLQPITLNSQPFDDYNVVNAEFLGRLKGLFDEIFNPEIPFAASADDHACKYCAFKAICHRQ